MFLSSTRKWLAGISVCFSFLFLSVPVFSQSIVGFYPLPDETFFNFSAYGLDSDGQNVYISSTTTTASPGRIYKFDTNGSKVDSFETGLKGSQGLAFDGTDFWYFQRTSPSKIYKVTTGGVVLDSIETGTSFVGGLGWDSTGLWYSIYFPDASAGYYKVDVNTKDIIDTIAVFPMHKQPQSIAWDGQYYYLSLDDFSGDPKAVWIYDPVLGDTVGTVPLLDPISQDPRGIAWDGQHLWLIADPVGSVENALFQFDLVGGGTPNILLSETEFDYQNVVIGTQVGHTIFISNSGTDTLQISGVTNSNPTIFSTTAPNLTIPPGSNTSIVADFIPTVFGRDSALIQITSNDINDPVVDVWLFGSGIYPDPEIALSAVSHDFGTVWTNNNPTGEGSAFWNLVIDNQGAAPLELQNISTGTAEFEYLNEITFPITIDSVGRFVLQTAFVPSGPGLFTDTLRILTNDASDPVVDVLLQGTGDTTALGLGSVMWTYQVPDHPSTGFDDFRVVAMKTIEDVSGDGYEEVVVASENYWILCLNGNGAGVTDTVWKFTTYVSNFSAGSIGSTGELPSLNKALAITEDLNADGKQDVVIGTGGGNERVYALDGEDGSVLWKFGTDHPDSFGLGDINSVWVGEDFNGDLVDDVLATGSGTNDGLAGRRTVYCFDGTNGNKLWSYFVGSMLRSAVSLGNADGSGGTDVAVATGNGSASAYRVVGFDSQTLSPIWSYNVGSTNGGGKELMRYDVDGETADVIVGTYTNLGGGGTVYRIDGATGTQVWAFTVNRAVMQLSLIKDVNNDGLDDILVSILDTDIAGGPGIFYCLSGATGQPVWNVTLGDATYSARAIVDVSGDGFNDAVVACRNDSLYALDGKDGAILMRYGVNSGELQGATAVYTISDLDNNGSDEILVASDGGQVIALSGGTGTLVGIDFPDPKAIVPDRVWLGQNYPNPFNPVTTIRYAVPESGRVSMAVYNLLGQRVRGLVNRQVLAGEHFVTWDGKNDFGATVSSGIYVYRVEAGDVVKSRKLMFLK